MAETVLETERLVLRPPVVSDLPWVLEHMNTLAVLRYLGGEIRSAQAVAESLDEDIAAFSSGGQQRWTVWLRDSAQRVGRVGLFPLRSLAAPPLLQGQTEIGWTFAESHWGNGYANEAARAVIAYAFETPSRPLLYSQTSDSNAASTRMMQRLGFTRRPELDYVDPDYPVQDNPTTVWSLDRTQWRTGA